MLYNLGMSEVVRVGRIPKVGRPKKWETVEELEAAIQGYFNSCFIPKMTRQRVRVENPDCECDLGAGDCKCRPIYESVDVPLKDGDGEIVYEQIRPFTVTGLAVALDTTRETLLDYEKKTENAEFSDAIKNAKQMIHNYAEEYLFSGKNVVGAIFNLKNNWGYVDRIETDNLNKNVDLDDDKVKQKVSSMFDDD